VIDAPDGPAAAAKAVALARAGEVALLMKGDLPQPVLRQEAVLGPRRRFFGFRLSVRAG